MKDVLKINRDKNVFVTSDTHFGHNKSFIYESRGYSSIQEHDASIIEILNDKVNEDDILFHLGDFCLNVSFDKFENILNKIKCKTIYYIWGNHNSQISQAYKCEVEKSYGKNMEVYPTKYKNIIYLGNQFECCIYGKYIVMNHFPLLSWNYMTHGSWHLHGHEHCKIKEHLPDGNSGKILDVGWDYYKSPILFNELEIIMNKKTKKSIGHH